MEIVAGIVDTRANKVALQAGVKEIYPSLSCSVEASWIRQMEGMMIIFGI